MVVSSGKKYSVTLHLSFIISRLFLVENEDDDDDAPSLTQRTIQSAASVN